MNKLRSAGFVRPLWDRRELVIFQFPICTPLILWIGLLLIAGLSCSTGLPQQARCWKLTSLERGSRWGILIDQAEILRMRHNVTEYCNSQGQRSLIRDIQSSKQLDSDSIQLPDLRLVSEFEGHILFGVSSNDVIFMDGKAYLPSAELIDRIWHMASLR